MLSEINQVQRDKYRHIHNTNVNVDLLGEEGGGEDVNRMMR
jgi:hypothetical protein